MESNDGRKCPIDKIVLGSSFVGSIEPPVQLLQNIVTALPFVHEVVGHAAEGIDRCGRFPNTLGKQQRRE
jgi:hypothetical protein